MLPIQVSPPDQFHTPLKLSLPNSISKLDNPQLNAPPSVQCSANAQTLLQSYFQPSSDSHTNQLQTESAPLTQLTSSLTGTSGPQIIIVGNPRPVSGRNNVFSLGGNSQQPAPSIFIIPSLSANNVSAVSQQDSDVMSLLESFLRGNSNNNNSSNTNSNNNNTNSNNSNRNNANNSNNSSSNNNNNLQS
eukprot:XP_014781104.1 PREDICTED: frizzled and smoothened-like protein O [Octopus bimaculoides]